MPQVLEEEQKFLKLLEVLGQYTDKGSVIIFVDKQEHADGLLKAGLAIKNPPKKTHLQKPTKNGFFWVLKKNFF
jgi:ATP-dependent RNA helicase DDX46/PRP5